MDGPVVTTVNGVERACHVDDRTLLCDLLRDELRLTGTKIGCGHGACGSCTVHVDGVPVRSCLTLAAQVDGREVETVESLGTDGQASHRLQEAFHRNHALQCGFCTPGFLMTLSPLVASGRTLTEDEAREAVSGNLCRCTGYEAIVDALLEATGSVEVAGD